MKPVFITARDIPDLWYQLLSETVEFGREYQVTQGSTPSKRWELDFVSAQITHPWVRPLVPDMPPGLGIPPPVSQDYPEKALQYYLTDTIAENEDYTYGLYLAQQIEDVIKYYRQHGPGTKHCYMTVGSFIDLERYRSGGTTPCLRGIDTAIKYGALHFSIHFRSWNLWNGLPANLACLQMVKEYMADNIGINDGQMFITCLKLGLAESCFEIAKRRVYVT